ncbi:MAG TPA: apolipoprotein N-acyltransferase [Chthoniobacterales bacterium]|nr:apolipoprotein N-acyltransferase [Chthoniobacterales bacterium]
MLRLWPWLAAALTGVLGFLCFAPFEQTWLCWIALTPLLAAVWFSGERAKRRWLRDLLLGYVGGVIFFWGVFYWLYTVTVPGLILVGLYMGVYFALWSWLAGLLRPNESVAEVRAPWLSSLHNLWLALILASAWTALEWVRSWMFSGWGWNGFGVALHGILPLIQIAEYTGVAGLSFLVAFGNVIAITTARRFILEAKVRARRPHYDFTLTLAAIVGISAFGIRSLQVKGGTEPLRVAAVQANVPREEKFSREFQEKTFENFTRLTQLALASRPPPQLIIWPESSTPAPALLDEENYRFVMELSATIKTDLLLGTIDADQTPADYNAALLVSNEGRNVQVYRKLHLVPFGEYVPGRNTVPLVARIVGDQVPADFTPGKEPVVFRLTTDELKVAPLICFEDTLGELTRQFVLRGANLLANVTNDGWFLRTAASQQHLENAIFRCIETRRPMARAANTGLTCFVNRFGRVTQVLLDAKGSQFTEGVLSGTIAVPTDGRLTFYVRHGELFAKICGAVALLFLVFQLPRFVRRTSGSANVSD